MSPGSPGQLAKGRVGTAGGSARSPQSVQLASGRSWGLIWTLRIPRLIFFFPLCSPVPRPQTLKTCLEMLAPTFQKHRLPFVFPK